MGRPSHRADPAIRRLVSDMVETMIDANGAGLAAPQVHVPLRVVVFQAPAERSDPGLSEDERFDHTAPLTVLVNSATGSDSDLANTVRREAATMQRQVEHHLARARAVGRRGAAQARANVRESVDSVSRAVGLLYPNVRLDAAGDRTLVARLERQDLDELIGNLLENAAKYGGGSVFVTIQRDGNMAEILVEDDGAGISPADRERVIDRGVRLDSGKPGTGLGLAIVRDVAEIYGGSIALEESEDLGGLLVRLRLPAG